MICGESLLNVKRVLYFDPKLSFEVLVDVTNIKLSYILIIKGTRYTNFLNVFFFWNRTLHVSDRFSIHRQECSTV